MTKMGQKLSREEKIQNALLKRKLRYAKMLKKRPKLKRLGKRRHILPLQGLPLPKLVKKADTVFSVWIRNRDGNRCVTPTEKCKGCIQGSHLIKKGKHAIRWDERNVHAQCQHHNFSHDQANQPTPEVLTSYVIQKYGVDEYLSLVEESKRVVSSAWVRQKAEEVIQKYGG